jgi:hypothetical protein
MIIISRWVINDDGINLNPEFAAIRYAWASDTGVTGFWDWLIEKNIKFDSVGGMTIGKIIFNNEKEYLLFKLKHL